MMMCLPQAVEVAAYGAAPWGVIGGIFSSTAKWIWTADNEDVNEVWCRSKGK